MMRIHLVVVASLFPVLFAFAVLPVFGDGIDAVSITVSIPFGGLPPLFGVTIRSGLPFGYGVASLLISPSGQTLIRGGAEIPLGEGGSYLAVTGGIAYFDLNARFPSPVLGGGLSYRIPEHGLQFGINGEIIYPIALGPPLLSLEGGWSR